MIRRLAAAFAIAFWLGGFTFYALVVIPAGTTVLGGAVAQGFVTQRVTAHLNKAAIVALAVLAWNAFRTRTAERARVGNALRITWVVMLVCQVALFLIHPYLDRLLDTQQRAVVEHERFYAIHRGYLLTTTAQWIAGVGHFILAMLDWRDEDQGGRI